MEQKIDAVVNDVSELKTMMQKMLPLMVRLDEAQHSRVQPINPADMA